MNPELIVRRIAAAAADGFEHSQRAPQPRSVAGWVRLCRSAADTAAAAIRAYPPYKQPREQKPGPLVRFLKHLQDTKNEEAIQAGLPPPHADLEEHEPERMSGEELERAALRAASKAYRSAMPLLASKRAARAYIACVATGLQLEYFTPTEGRTLLYNAQLGLAAFKETETGRPKRLARQQQPTIIDANPDPPSRSAARPSH